MGQGAGKRIAAALDVVKSNGRKPEGAGPGTDNTQAAKPGPMTWSDRVKSEHERLFGAGAKMSPTTREQRVTDSPAEVAMTMRPRAAGAGKDINLPRYANQMTKETHTITWDKLKKK